MIRFFRKRKNQESSLKEAAERRIAHSILNWQRRCAEFINRSTRHWSKGQKTAFLIVCSALIGANSGIALYQAFNGKHRADQLIPAGMTKQPHGIKETFHNKDPVLPPARQRIHRFYLYLDSLKKTPAGRQRYDSFHAARPGLIDSIMMIEQMSP